MTNKKNRTSRHFLDRLFSVYQIDTNQQIGYLQNISAEGALIVSETNFKQDQKIHLKLNIEDQDEEIKNVDFEVICKWTKEGSYKGLFEIGFKFIDNNSYLQEGINYLIKRFSFASY